MSLTHRTETINMTRKGNFVRFARGLLADPAIDTMLTEGAKKFMHELISKVADYGHEELKLIISSKIGPVRMLLGKSAGDFSVTFEDIVKLLLHQDAPAEIFRALLMIQVNRGQDFNKLMLYANFFLEAFGN